MGLNFTVFIKKFLALWVFSRAFLVPLSNAVRDKSVLPDGSGWVTFNFQFH